MALNQRFSQILSALLFFIGKVLYPSLQVVPYLLSGVYRHRSRIAAGEVKDLTVEVFNIHSKFPGQPMMMYRLWLYLFWHERFVNPSYLLKPNITLLRVDKEKVYFLEHDVSQNVYDCRKYPFFFLAQFELSKKLIVVPMKEFIKMGEKIGDPNCSVSWIFHTSRCGSTALVQALNVVENMTVISESLHMVLYLAEYGHKYGDLQDYINHEDFTKVAMSCVKYFFKDFSENQKVAYKTTGIWEYKYLLPMVMDKYPKHKIISMYRDGKSTIDSLYSASGVLEGFLHIMDCFPFKWVSKDRRIFMRYTLSNGMLRDDNSCLYFILFCQWVSNIVDFRKSAKPSSHMMTILYDDLLSSKEQTITQVFNYLSIDLDNISIALKALEEDSQKNTPMARDRIKQKWKRDEQVIIKCEQLLRKFGLPSYDSKFRFTKSLDIEIISP